MKFDFSKWNVKLIQNPFELMIELNRLNVKYKPIKSIRLVGYAFALEDIIDPYDLDGNIVVFDDDEFVKYVEIDEPFIIEFEGGDCLEIDYSEGSSIKVGLNSLPKDIETNIGKNVDGNVFFSECIGKEIIGYAVEMEDGPLDWYFTSSSDISIDYNQDLYISKFRIVLTKNLSLEFESWHDFGHVALLKYNSDMKITRKEIMESLIKEK